MTNYILKRIGLAVLSLFILTFLAYILLAVFSPADPFVTLTGNTNNADVADETRKIAAGFDKPVVERYFIWLGKVLSGNNGQLYAAASQNTAVNEVFFGPLPYTIRFVLPSFLASVLLGTTLGIVSAYKRGTWIDHSVQFFVRVFVSVPSFVIAPFALILAYRIGFIPYVNVTEGVFSASAFRSYTIPVVLVTILSLSGYASIARNNTVDVLGSNYVLIARSKGLRESAIFFKYVLRNTSIPLVSVILPGFLGLLSGSFVIESFFGIPGTSQQFIQAFPTGEIDLSMYNILFFGSLSVILSIIIDLMFVILDPRIKIAASSELSWYKRLHLWAVRKRIQSQADQGIHAQGKDHLALENEPLRTRIINTFKRKG